MRESVRGWPAATLRRMRLAADLTQEYLAGMVGCSAAAIATWEGGRHDPRPRLAAALARYSASHHSRLLRSPAAVWHRIRRPYDLAALDARLFQSTATWIATVAGVPTGRLLHPEQGRARNLSTS